MDSILIAGASQASEGSIPSENNTKSLATLTLEVNRIPYGLSSPAIAMSDDVVTAWDSEINALSTAVSPIAGDDDSTLLIMIRCLN